MTAPNRVTDVAEKGLDYTSQRLESQLKEAEVIVYRWFRFRTRRGLGILYCVFSFLPVLGSLLYAASDSLPLALAGGTIVGLGCSLILREVAFKGFGRMGSTIDMLKGRNLPRTWRRAPSAYLIFAVSPWIGYAVATTLGSGPLELLFSALWFIEMVLLMTRKRDEDSIVGPRIDDWVAAVSFPIGALLSTLPGLPIEVHHYGFLLVSPLLLLSGVKSLYDAPREFALDLSTAQG